MYLTATQQCVSLGCIVPGAGHASVTSDSPKLDDNVRDPMISRTSRNHNQILPSLLPFAPLCGFPEIGISKLAVRGITHCSVCCREICRYPKSVH